jgi:hypothetical protein
MTKKIYDKDNRCHRGASVLDNGDIYSYYFKNDDSEYDKNNFLRFTEAHLLFLISLDYIEDDINNIKFFKGQYISIFCKFDEIRYIEYLNKDKKYNCLFEHNYQYEFSLFIFYKKLDV